MTSQFKQRILANQEKLINGETTILPLNFFPKLKAYIPGFIKGDYLIVTGASGCGKTSFVYFLIKYFMNLKIKDLEVEVLYNSLEETPDKVKSSFILERLSKRDIHLSFYDLMGYAEAPLSSETVAAIKEEIDKTEADIFNRLTVISQSNIKTFYESLESYLMTQGSFINGTYVEHNPNKWHVVVIDHMGNLEFDDAQKELRKLSSFYIRQKLCMQFNCLVILIQQQVQAKEQLNLGLKKKFIDAVKPSVDGLSIYKFTNTDATLVLGVFDPWKYQEHLANNKYEVGNRFYELSPKLRSLVFLKTREGVLANRELVVKFDGRLKHFEQYD